MEPIIRFDRVTFQKFNYTVFRDTCWEINPGENWAITGSNGSGKTTFLEAVEGHLSRPEGHIYYHFTDKEGHLLYDPYKQMASVYFNDRSVKYGNYYYQQRYHATETDGIITVRKFLGGNPDMSRLQAFDIDRLLDMEIIKLSNGQFKKMLIAKALSKKPKLLLLDNLYTGLDAEARAYISEMIGQIAGSGTQLIIVTDHNYIPSFITHVMEVERFNIKQVTLRKDYINLKENREPAADIPSLPCPPAKTFDIAVKMDKVCVAYNGKTVIDQVDWTVKYGERWALVGPNGAGKSMLLSLIFADNPQAYSNHIILFDRKRGSGESIWDIKDRIGFVSPELHLYLSSRKSCHEIALSGLFENPYASRKIPSETEKFLNDLFHYFSVASISGIPFQQVSTGQQNIILLIRALVKNPAMLILDEPFQSMDAQTIELFRQLLDRYCRNRTLIFVSHRSEDLLDHIDHCIYINHGKAVVQQ